MNSRHTLRWPLKAIAMGGLLACVATSSSAVSMGRLRGAAWLGQPLDVTIQVQLDEGETPASLCFEAEVFHGDVRQDAARVRVSVESTADARLVQLRLLSGTPVDEPVVTVYGRETCLSKSTRRYVLLSEIPTDVVIAPAAASSNLAAGPVGVTTAPPVVASASAPAPTPAASASSIEPARSQSAAPIPVATKSTPKLAQKNVAPQPAQAASKPTKPAAAAPAAPAKAKLKLDPVETLSERVALLETRQADAPAASASEVQRLKKLEDNLQNLVSLAAKNERAMAELRERLQQAEAEKYDNPLVYGLAGLLLAALGGGAYMWRRQQQHVSGQGAWWRGTDAGPGTEETAGTPRAGHTSATAAVAAGGVTAGEVAVTLLAAEEPASSLPQIQPAADEIEAIPSVEAPEIAQSASEIDLDDLLTVGTATEDHPEAELPAPVSGNTVAEESVVPEFPSLGEVTIDVSHLSLSPVEEAAPAEPLLDFDLTSTTEEPEASPKPERGTNA